jgi:hypothetical protein
MSLATDVAESFTTPLSEFKGGFMPLTTGLNAMIYAINCIQEAAKNNKDGVAGGGVEPHFLDSASENGVMVYYNVKGQRATL